MGDAHLQIEAMTKTLHDIVHPASAVHGAAREQQALHVLMLPYPLQGHINPMMQFAKALIAGHPRALVTFVNNKHNHDRIQSTQSYIYPNSPASPSPNILQISRCNSPAIHSSHHHHQHSKLQFLWVDDGLPPDFDYTDLAPRLLEFHSATYKMKDPFKQLLQDLNQKEPSVSCVLFGSFCPWAHSVAAEFGIPSIFFWTQSTAVFSMYYHVPLLVANDFFPYNKKALAGFNDEGVKPHMSTSDQLVSYIPGVPCLHPSVFPTLLHIDSISDPSFATINEQFAVLQNCEGVVINSFEELEKETYQALQEKLPCPVSLVGPLIPSAFLDGGDQNDTSTGASLLQEKRECIQWLDRHEIQSVLYISFGSVFNLSAEDIDGIACGIRGQKQPFLWVIRPRSSLRDVADIMPKAFMEDTKDYGLIIPWAPQAQVLAHPSVGAFLTHCGWNSTIESASMGVPLIPFPFMSDQPTNCMYVCDVWKIGMALRKQDDGKLNSEDVERVLRVVFKEEEGKEMKRRASRLKEAARRAALAQGSSKIHMERVTKAMRNQISVRGSSLT